MLLTVFASVSFATGEGATVAPVEIDVTKVNDGNKILVSFNLKSGNFNGIDLDFDMNGLLCLSIEPGDSFDNTDSVFAKNTDDKAANNFAMISLNGVNPGTFAVATFEIIDHEYSFSVKSTSCCVATDEGNIEVEPSITGAFSGDTHEYTPTVTAPTCKDGGYTTYTCSCGDSYVDGYVDALGHDADEWIVTVPETSFEDGVKIRKCSVCDTVVETQIVPKLGAVHSVDISDISMDYKTSFVLTPEIVADEGVEYKVEYSSSDTSVVTVDENGNVYTVDKGTATITCTVTDAFDNVVTDTCEIQVKYTWWQWIIVIVLFGWIWY